eukprot:811409-Amphidinium_carterae.1
MRTTTTTGQNNSSRSAARQQQQHHHQQQASWGRQQLSPNLASRVQAANVLLKHILNFMAHLGNHHAEQLRGRLIFLEFFRSALSLQQNGRSDRLSDHTRSSLQNLVDRLRSAQPRVVDVLDDAMPFHLFTDGSLEQA